MKNIREIPPILMKNIREIPPILMKNIREIPHYPEPKTTTIIS